MQTYQILTGTFRDKTMDDELCTFIIPFDDTHYEN